jgi:hypothetical protein
MMAIYSCNHIWMLTLLRHSNLTRKTSYCSQILHLLEYFESKTSGIKKDEIIAEVIQNTQEFENFSEEYMEIEIEKKEANLGSSEFYYDIPSEEKVILDYLPLFGGRKKKEWIIKRIIVLEKTECQTKVNYYCIKTIHT